MKSKTFIPAVLCVAIAVTGTSVLARDGGPRGMDFDTLDTNSDGLLTQAELDAAHAARVAKIDADGDGFVTSEELQAMGRKSSERRAERMLERMDADKDGKLSLEEMKPREGRGDKMFDRVDANDDGSISREEFDEARAKMKEHRKDGHKHGKKPAEDAGTAVN